MRREKKKKKAEETEEGKQCSDALPVYRVHLDSIESGKENAVLDEGITRHADARPSRFQVSSRIYRNGFP